VVWEAGEIRAVAYIGGQAVATESKHTVGPPVALRMTPITAPGGWRADGSDIALIDVEAVDAKGDRCPTFQQRVDFEIAGPGVWRGGYNSGRIKSTNNTYLDLEAGINRVSVRATRTAGEVTVRVTGQGLKPASVTLKSVAFPVAYGASKILPATPAAELGPRSATVVSPVETATVLSQKPLGKFVTVFSYSGPASSVHVEPDAQNGKALFIDAAICAEALPGELKGADFVQASQADRLYHAVDLMEVAVKAGSTVWIAHDDRLARPAWLTQRFQPTDLAVTIDGHAMHLYRYRAERAESLTLGSNVERPAGQPANMYLVFVTE
jgi:beta-galactosidase